MAHPQRPAMHQFNESVSMARGHTHSLAIASERTGYLCDMPVAGCPCSTPGCAPNAHLIARHRASAEDGFRARSFTSFRYLLARLELHTRVLPRELRTESRWRSSRNRKRHAARIRAWVGGNGDAKMRAVTCGLRSRCQRQLRMRTTTPQRGYLRSVTSPCCS